MGKSCGNFEKQLKGKDIVLVLLSKADYSETAVELLKAVAKPGGNVCYVSANKPVSALIKSYGSAGVNIAMFRFVDCAGSSAAAGAGSKGTIVFVNSPRNLTEISIAVSDMIKGGKSSVLVDALSTFLIYEASVVVVKFAHSMITKIREGGNKGIFIILKNDISKSMIDDLSMFADGVIEV